MIFNFETKNITKYEKNSVYIIDNKIVFNLKFKKKKYKILKHRVPRRFCRKKTDSKFLRILLLHKSSVFKQCNLGTICGSLEHNHKTTTPEPYRHSRWKTIRGIRGESSKRNKGSTLKCTFYKNSNSNFPSMRNLTR